MHEHILDGCRPVPLAHYLKALGILRLVSEQADDSAAGAWLNDRFVLRTSLDKDELEHFFLERYEPTPLVAPWNGGSGFYPGDKGARVAVDAILAGSAERFGGYRGVIQGCDDLLTSLGLEEKPDSDDKARVLDACRGLLPDRALEWLDAAYVLTEDGAKYPPLLGTGGNDGRLEFSANFMKRLTELFDPGTGLPATETIGLLRLALWARVNDGLGSNPIGQFQPGNAGGANAGTGFGASSQINSWDFVLLLEGALVFAAAAVKRMGSNGSGALAYPFTVRQVAAGYGSASDSDEKDSRAEMWLPLWGRFIRLPELRAILGEGRARVASRPARNGTDFARAVASLGVDRGLSAFQRYGFQVRNGLSYFAAPLGRHPVSRSPQMDLVAEIDDWLDRLRGRATSDTAPASVQRAFRAVDSAIFAAASSGSRADAEALLLALGDCEAQLARSLSWANDTKAQKLPPVPALSPKWLARVDDGSAELRLACALASTAMWVSDKSGARRPLWWRDHLESSSTRGRWRTWVEPASNDVVDASDLVRLLADVMSRRLVRAKQSGHKRYSVRATVFAEPSDIAAFIEGRTDDRRLLSLLRAVALIDWDRLEGRPLARASRDLSPDAAYGLLKLCFGEHPVRGVDVPLVPLTYRLAASGQGDRAVRSAARRLRACGLPPIASAACASAPLSRRIAAALAFPLGRSDLDHLSNRMLRATQPDTQQGANP